MKTPNAHPTTRTTHSAKPDNYLKATMLTILFLALITTITLSLLLLTNNQTNPQEETVIGVLLPLTGPVAVHGESVRDGIVTYQAEAKATNPNAHFATNVRFIFEDSQCDPKAGVKAARKLIDIDKVDVLVGAVCSSVTLAIAPLTEEKQILHISPLSSAPSLTDTHVFRLYPSDTFQAVEVAKLMEKRGHKNVGVLYLDNDYGVQLNDAFASLWKTQNPANTITSQAAIEQDGDDFRTQILKVAETDPDAIYVVGMIHETGLLLKQFYELGYKINDLPLFGAESIKSEELFTIAPKEIAEGLEFVAAGTYEGPKGKSFTTTYQSINNKNPPLFADYGYTVMELLDQTVANTDSSYKDTKDFLIKTEFHTPLGKIDFDSNGDVNRVYDIIRITNGEFVVIE